tara:strand:+ start:337 stop:768 length:432 start_codon:yes stop_codon:yes gene_type:complete
MLKKGLFGIIGTKILFFLKPELKIVVRNIVICAIFIALTIYIHSEYINWSEISGNSQFITLSFILKNILIVFSLIFLFFSVKRSKFKNDGFDKFRNKELKRESEKNLKPQENSTKTEIDDAYFDKFRNKKKLRTTQEIKLEKK